MKRESPTAIDEEGRAELVAEAAGLVGAALQSLRRVLQGDEEAVGAALAGILAATGAEIPEEPVVIRAESIGATELVTLREYIEVHVQDREIGIREAEEILAEAPSPLVTNLDEAIRHPEFLQLHTAIEPRLLASEIERLRREG
jgi:hypothetical protein